MIKFILGSLFNKNGSSYIDKNNSIRVYDGPINLDYRSSCIPFRQYFTIDGTPLSSNQMAITTGTLAAPVDFFIKASNKRTIVITYLNFYIAGSAAVLAEFGTGPLLTNGCRIFYKDARVGEVDIHEAVKTNFDLVRLTGGSPSFGTGTDAFRLYNTDGLDEAFIPKLDLSDFVPPYGIQLDKDSDQRITISIRDNTLTNRASSFNCIAYGFEVIE